ncbi:CPBP family intramembrane metalloprotease [Streptosporangiaceae bacterium NEAU-GS5]|nr:CPBP family intramembrane metalloprotease [Streptosporangiaceae bacterium NEAU-GS5]
MLVLFGVVFVAVNAVTSALRNTGLLALVAGVLAAAGAVAAYAYLVRRLERRPAVEVARAAAVSGLRRGILIGLLLFTVTIALIALFGGYRVSGFGSVFGALAILGTMAASAVVEEVLFRGIVFRLVEELAGTRGALIVSALLFGLLHLTNPGATIWGALAIAVEAGVMLGAAYAATRTLWLAIGVHFGWNFAEGGIFGTTVSGSEHGPVGLLTATLPGPEALTGGGFGPEASLFAIVVCAVPAVLFLRAARRRGLMYPRRRGDLQVR